VPRRLADLDPAARRRVIVRTAAAGLLNATVLVAVYFAMPTERPNNIGSGITIAIGLTVFVVVIVGAARRIMVADLPELRAARSLATIIPLFILVFSRVYLTMSTANSGNFTERLDRNSALYFTTTVLATVGFGDIAPKTGEARLVVSFQMILDLVIIGVLVRVLTRAAQAGLNRAGIEPR